MKSVCGHWGVLLGLLLLACSRPIEPLRIGLNSWPGYEFLYLAEAKGFYRARNVDVRLVEFNSLPDARAALERGHIDGLGTTVVEVLMARVNKAFAPQITRVVDYSNGADQIIARRGLTDIASLKGKRIGVELGSLGIYVLVRALEQSGLKLSDVVTVSSDQLTMVEQLHSGLLDAIVTYPPVSIDAANLPGCSILFTTAQIPGEVVDVLAFSERVLRERKQDVARVHHAFEDALQYAKREREEAIAIMAKREGLSPLEFEKALTDGLTLVYPEGQAAFLGSGGSIRTVMDRTRRVLQECGQVADTSSFAEAVSWVNPD